MVYFLLTRVMFLYNLPNIATHTFIFCHFMLKLTTVSVFRSPLEALHPAFAMANRDIGYVHHANFDLREHSVDHDRLLIEGFSCINHSKEE